MSTIIEDPGIPLVGRNGGMHLYTQDSQASTPEKPRKPRWKFENVGYRLARRKELFIKRRVICDFALFFAMLGIGLMVMETELVMGNVYTKTSISSIIVKLFITISTVTLIGFAVWYHVLDVQLFMIDNGMEDWKLAMTNSRVARILLELLVYAIHPIPGAYDFKWTTMNPETKIINTVTVPVDVLLSLPMFLRFYLIGRVMMLHSKLFTDASSQSLGALNRIHFNFKFIFKSLMSLNPGGVLLVIMFTGFFVASWALRACEMYHDEIHANFFNSMWLIAITFLSVGYGDIVPISHCGRAIAVLTGIFGAGCTALVVAVFARKLELSRAEKYVHNFVIDVELDKRFRNAAANILKEGWLIYKSKKKGKGEAKIRAHQRKLLHAIHNIREVKQEQRRITDSAVTMVEMAKTQSSVYTLVNTFAQKQAEHEDRIRRMDNKLSAIDSKLDELCKAVTGRHRRE